MPHRLLWTPLSPRQLFLRLQLPFAAAILLISAAMLLAVPTLRDSQLLLLGGALTIVASSLFLVPRRRWLESSWIVVIPLLDIVAIACVRAALISYLPAIGMICLLPFAWIAYRFRWPGLLVVFAGGIFIAALPIATAGYVDFTLLSLLNLTTLPFIATGISVGIHWGAAAFRNGVHQVEEASLNLHRALQKSHDDELLLRSVLDTVSSAVAFYDARNELVLANHAATQMAATSGFRLDSPPYGGPEVLMADRQTPIPVDEQTIPRALRGEVIARHLEWLGAPGSQTAFLASSRRVHRDDGQLLGTVIAAYDVTDLANAIEVREEFLTTVSHELRTPLTSIIGYTDEVIDTLGDASESLGVAAHLETISRNADVLLDRVSQLLTAADKQIDLQPQEIDLSRLMADITSPLRLSAKRAGVTLSTDAPPTLTAEVDPARITQAVENLITNAIKFTPRGGTISATVDRTNTDDVLVTVTDTGIGMAPDEQRRVFDRFYRAQAVRQNAVQGIGIGLSIVKDIIDAHRGHITVDSAPGTGTTITLRLPRRQTSSNGA